MKVLKYTGGIFQTNAFYFTVNSKHFLIDAPEGVGNWLKEKGIDKIDYVLITHQHFDHIQDFGKLRELFDFTSYAWSKEDDSLTLQDFLASLGLNLEIKDYKIDEILEAKNEVILANYKLEIIHIQGHSPDSVAFYNEDDGVLFGGDILFLEGIGRTDFAGCSSEELIKGIKTKLLPLNPDTKVYTGHGEDTTIGYEKNNNTFLK